MAIRGSPAKGVDGLKPCVGSNPTFRATSSGDNGFRYHHSIFLFHLPRIEADLFFADVLLMIILLR